MSVLLVFGFFAVITSAHNITSLEVPWYGDPRAPAALGCHYVNDKGDPPLHSVKWYQGNDEIFRYTPGQQPTTRTFNSSTGGGVTGACNQHSCFVTVKLPKTYNTRVSFTCEVSTEGPRFAVVKQTKNLTVAVILKEDPVISEVPGSVQIGEEVLLNCTTVPAMPPANIVWYIDGKPERVEKPWLVNNTQVSAANEKGLRSSWRALRYVIRTSKGYSGVRCEATQPTWPPHVRVANATVMVTRSPHISMFTASGSSSLGGNGLIVATYVLVHMLSKYSALIEIANSTPPKRVKHRYADPLVSTQ